MVITSAIDTKVPTDWRLYLKTVKEKRKVEHYRVSGTNHFKIGCYWNRTGNLWSHSGFEAVSGRDDA